MYNANSMAKRNGNCDLTDLLHALAPEELLHELKAYRNELILVTVGRTGEGKSAVVNSFLQHATGAQRPSFVREEATPYSITQSNIQRDMRLFGLNLSLFDTRGLFDCPDPDDLTSGAQTADADSHTVALRNLAQLIKEADAVRGGVDTFFIVIDATKRFTNEQKETINIILEHFGYHVLDYSIFVLSHSDRVEQGSLADVKGAIIQHLDDKGYSSDSVKDRFVNFDNKTRPLEQIVEALMLVQNVVSSNIGQLYHCRLFETAQQVLSDNLCALKLAQSQEIEGLVEMEMAFLKLQLEEEALNFQVGLQANRDQMQRIIEQNEEEREQLQEQFNQRIREMEADFQQRQRDRESRFQETLQHIEKQNSEKTEQDIQAMESRAGAVQAQQLLEIEALKRRLSGRR